MQKPIVVCWIAGLVALFASVANGEPITYQLVPAVMDGRAPVGTFTLSGSITTDGTIGELGPGNITAWEWTATDGTNTFSASGGVVSIVASYNDVVASATSLSLPFSTDVDFSSLSINSTGDPDGTRLLFATTDTDTWNSFADVLGPSSLDSQYMYPELVDATRYVGQPSGNYVFATASPAPEPSTLTLGGFAGLAPLAYRKAMTAIRENA